MTRIYLTEIPESPTADVYFHLDPRGFTVVDEKVTAAGLRFTILERSLLG